MFPGQNVSLKTEGIGHSLGHAAFCQRWQLRVTPRLDHEIRPQTRCAQISPNLVRATPGLEGGATHLVPGPGKMSFIARRRNNNVSSVATKAAWLGRKAARFTGYGTRSAGQTAIL